MSLEGYKSSSFSEGEEEFGSSPYMFELKERRLKLKIFWKN